MANKQKISTITKVMFLIYLSVTIVILLINYSYPGAEQEIKNKGSQIINYRGQEIYFSYFY